MKPIQAVRQTLKFVNLGGYGGGIHDFSIHEARCVWRNKFRDHIFSSIKCCVTCHLLISLLS